MALSRLVVVSVVGCVVVVLLGVRTTGIKMTLIKQISFPLLQIPFPSSPLLLSHPSAPDGICLPTTPHPHWHLPRSSSISFSLHADVYSSAASPLVPIQLLQHLQKNLSVVGVRDLGELEGPFFNCRIT
jgi:hypothetical protein